MADQCIVCLENLDVEVSAAGAALAAADAPQHLHHPSSPAAAAEASGCLVAVQQQPETAKPVAPAVSTNPAIDSNLSLKQHENHDHAAQIAVCGHVLHDSCLREWSEKANSCPICRQTFNLVHVFDKVGGMYSIPRKHNYTRATRFHKTGRLDVNC